MAKINILFDGTDYSIDEANLEPASAELKTHLSSVMNGTGATINFGGTAYSVDSTKLSNARNNLVSHLGTIAGSGSEVVVNGVKYSIDSSKISNPISALHTAFDNLQSGGSEEAEDELEGTWFINASISPNSSTITFNDVVGTFKFFTWDIGSYEQQDITSITLSTSATNTLLVKGTVHNTFTVYNSYYTSSGDIESVDNYGYKDTFSPDDYSEKRYITITSKLSEVTNGEALLTWLKANATKQ